MIRPKQVFSLSSVAKKHTFSVRMFLRTEKKIEMKNFSREEKLKLRKLFSVSFQCSCETCGREENCEAALCCDIENVADVGKISNKFKFVVKFLFILYLNSS